MDPSSFYSLLVHIPVPRLFRFTMYFFFLSNSLFYIVFLLSFYLSNNLWYYFCFILSLSLSLDIFLPFSLSQCRFIETLCALQVEASSRRKAMALKWRNPPTAVQRSKTMILKVGDGRPFHALRLFFSPFSFLFSWLENTPSFLTIIIKMNQL